MHLKTLPMMIPLVLFFIPPTAYAMEANPAACDCSTTEVSGQESAAGCSKEVKKEICDLVRQHEIWKDRFSQQREDRRKLLSRPIQGPR